MVSSATPTAISTEVPPSAPRTRLREAAVRDEEAREDGDEREEERARERQAREHAVEVLRRRRAGPDARDVAAVLAQVVGLVDRVELDRRVEVREDHDHEALDRAGRSSRRAGSTSLTKSRVAGKYCAIVGGNARIAAAKMIGMTPAMFTRSGR